MLLEILVQIIGETKTHKYLGRFLSGNLDARGGVEVAHRLQCAWWKFGQNAKMLTNRNISIKLRLKFFDSIVSPSLLFGLVALPISKNNFDAINICQRKMFRKIAGWVRYDGEEWEITMKRMNQRVQQGLVQFYVRPWSERIVCARRKYNCRLQNLPKDRWEQLSLQWEPTVVQDNSQEYFAHRFAGRPRLRWTDAIPTPIGRHHSDAIPL